MEVPAKDPDLACDTCLKEILEGEALCDRCKKPVHDAPPCLLECGECGGHFCVECDLGPVHGCGGDASAGSGSETSEDTASDSEDEVLEADRLDSYRDREDGEGDDPAPEGLIKDPVARVLHLEVLEGGICMGVCRCGAAVGDAWSALGAWPKVKGSMCLECF